MRLEMRNIGPVVKADIDFGDLTVFVGQQATGKSIALQFVKLLSDTGQIQAELSKHGIDWERKREQFFGVFFGEGMEGLWKSGSSGLCWNKEERNLDTFFVKNRPPAGEKLFYIPAPRVICLRDGWPRPFTDYSSGDPYVVRQFSEKLRLLMENEFSANATLFPRPNRLRKEYRRSLTDHMFSSFELQIESSRAKKRLVLKKDDKTDSLPYMVWSAGQREFVPLLLGLYWLLPAGGVKRREQIEWVVIEEPEMGLHPKAIMTTLLLVLDLLARNYKFIISTHYPLVLDVIWALRNIKEGGGDPSALAKLFDINATSQLKALASKVLSKDFRVFFFDSSDGCAHDISGLDPSATDDAESGWGGLTDFSGRIADVVSSVVADRESGYGR